MGRRAGLTLLVALILSQSVGAASDKAGNTADGLSVWTLQLTGGAFREAWDYNLSDEDLASVAAAVFRRFGRSWSVGAEGLLLGVHQERVPSTVASGLTVRLRWHHPRSSFDYFGELGAGVSYATGIVPHRGTQFNYIADTGVGVIRPLNDRTNLVAMFMWLHLSNNGLAGRSRNPDIQSLGLRLGIAIPLGQGASFNDSDCEPPSASVNRCASRRSDSRY